MDRQPAYAFEPLLATLFTFRFKLVLPAAIRWEGRCIFSVARLVAHRSPSAVADNLFIYFLMLT